MKNKRNKVTLFFIDLVRSHSFSLKEISVVHLYCANMDYFGDINAVYKTFFDAEPPTR